MASGTAQIASLARVARGHASIDTGVTYDGLRPVLVRISKRDGRYKVTDDGGAVTTAGADRQRVEYPEEIVIGDHSVNVSRQGIVWLPAVSPSDEWLTRLCALVAEGSVALYETLLELE